MKSFLVTALLFFSSISTPPIVVENQGSALTQRVTLNCNGVGIVCTDNSGAQRTDMTVSLGGGANLTTTGAVPFQNGTTGILTQDTRFTFLSGLLGAPGIGSTGNVFGLSGCSAGTPAGGSTIGQFVIGSTACSMSILMGGFSGVLTAPTGWACDFHDTTTPAAQISQTATTQSLVTLSVPVTAMAMDVIFFKCGWY